MERVTTCLVILSMNFPIQSFPIENGFSVKFNPMSAKEELRPRQFGALFAKIPQDFKSEEINRRELLTKGYFPENPEFPVAYSNQVAKLLYPTKYHSNSYSENMTGLWVDQVNFLNLPIVRQPYDNYKVLVASAPPNVQLGNDNKQTIIYVVFPDDGSNDQTVNNVPVIYFVNEKNAKINTEKKGPADPILIIDSNRTVTGLKSKEISKFIRFKNKWTNRFDYKLTP
ncbi:hypothetical protein B5X24_HaOG207337 [Helicoverpa armigera]|uniref:Uncharacterized protein n=1 Tax=Helicoverpa armigera TaxID=29058 RepID=A0A2W1BI38_HELAM|nr:uncharacterized protein LOC110379388 [Helicoverpa armigera]PZC74712.1 hypothetical protein B5X24_HaOG207337 [Helicoverpa armigera]